MSVVFCGWSLAAAFALAANWAAWMRVQHLRRALRLDPSELARGLQRDATRERLESLTLSVRETEGPCWEVAFWEDLLVATTQDEQAAAANEHLSDLELELEWGAAIPAGAARIGLLGPMCVAFFLAATGHASMGGLAPVFAWCLAGVLGPVWAGRAARQVAKDLRLGVDRLVARSVHAVGAEQGATRPAAPDENC